MTKTPPVSLALAALGIPHQVFEHPGPLRSLEQAAEERGQRLGQVVRSILFRKSQDSYIMVLIAGPNQINWKKLRNYLGTSRISMASKLEVHDVTGYDLGAVAPFGLARPLLILVDQSVLVEEELSMGSGVRNVAILLKSVDLLRALGDIAVGDFGIGEK
jgi:prolyl-tRNA editing enzyme YbaK/EbsC (Cys-tRNA(Pro) deacylase)